MVFPIARPPERRGSFRPSRMAALLILSCLIFTGAGQDIAWGNRDAQVTLLKDRDYASALLDGIRGARKSIVFSGYLFKVTPSPGNGPRMVAEELLRARSRGIDVTVIMEREEAGRSRLNEENRRTAAILSRGGVTVLFDTPARVSHLKLALMDDRYIYIGSHNLTQGALRYNRELSVLIDSPEMAREIRAYLGQR